jgi:indole-3-glycerol phosphate synthase
MGGRPRRATTLPGPMRFLAEVTARIRAELAAHPLDESALRDRLEGADPPRPLPTALRDATSRDGVAVIAEVKRASPSAGSIADPNPATQAAAYVAGGAAAVSVLTEPRHFGGSLDDLRVVATAVDVPVLRKDFLVHPTQLVEARAAGADTVLLIAASLDDAELATMLAVARELGMEPLVETHTDDDLARVLATDAEVVGVNARDLGSLEVDLDAAFVRLASIPPSRVAVLESGIGSRAQVEAAVDAGASGILVGEALMRAPDPIVQLRVLRGAAPADREEHAR